VSSRFGNSCYIAGACNFEVAPDFYKIGALLLKFSILKGILELAIITFFHSL
jgi:hypothetical protein